jgi:pullulanase-type alpha-1,6-glucosidase
MDSFRFDLMAHQPRDAMVALQAHVNKVAGRPVNLIGEGWNFGEIANGSRFVQASQLSLNGTGIGTFSDRGRDAVRGGSAGDNGTAQISNQGYINGMVYDRNALSKATPEELLRTADMVRVGLAGSLRNFEMLNFTGESRQLADIDYGGGQPAGYVSEPGEVVNYVENHDNQTLYDINMFRLPVGTPMHDRVRVQMLGVAINAFSQGVAYFHAGTEVLRSKSMDRNSFDSGDWFNRLDWSYQTNYFGTGLPPKQDNGESWPLMAPLLADPANRPAPADIAQARDMFLDLLKIRASTTLLRLRTAADIQSRLRFRNLGPQQNPVVLVGHVQGQLDGKTYPGARYKELLYFVNVDKVAQSLSLPEEAGKRYRLHPVHTAPKAADQRARSAQNDAATGHFTIPPRTAVVYVVQ